MNIHDRSQGIIVPCNLQISATCTSKWSVVSHSDYIRNTQASLLAVESGTKPRHFGDVMLTGKLLSANVFFQIDATKWI
jgi:hypothetical protein